MPSGFALSGQPFYLVNLIYYFFKDLSIALINKRQIMIAKIKQIKKNNPTPAIIFSVISTSDKVIFFQNQ